jgi:GDP-4-dehydro-6-deoxy-D-mannose reductase
MAQGTPGRIYNVCSGVGRSIRSVLDALVARSRTTVTVELDPEKLRPSDTPTLVGDPSRLRTQTGWAPESSFDDTMDALLEYWRRAA